MASGRAEAREVLGRDALDELEARGLLTESDREEVEVALALFLGRYRRGEISAHYFELLVDKLGDEYARRHVERRDRER